MAILTIIQYIYFLNKENVFYITHTHTDDSREKERAGEFAPLPITTASMAAVVDDDESSQEETLSYHSPIPLCIADAGDLDARPVMVTRQRIGRSGQVRSAIATDKRHSSDDDDLDYVLKTEKNRRVASSSVVSGSESDHDDLALHNNLKCPSVWFNKRYFIHYRMVRDVPRAFFSVPAPDINAAEWSKREAEIGNNWLCTAFKELYLYDRTVYKAQLDDHTIIQSVVDTLSTLAAGQINPDAGAALLSTRENVNESLYFFYGASQIPPRALFTTSWKHWFCLLVSAGQPASFDNDHMPAPDDYRRNTNKVVGMLVNKFDIAYLFDADPTPEYKYDGLLAAQIHALCTRSMIKKDVKFIRLRMMPSDKTHDPRGICTVVIEMLYALTYKLSAYGSGVSPLKLSCADRRRVFISLVDAMNKLRVDDGTLLDEIMRRLPADMTELPTFTPGGLGTATRLRDNTCTIQMDWWPVQASSDLRLEHVKLAKDNCSVRKNSPTEKQTAKKNSANDTLLEARQKTRLSIPNLGRK